MLESTLTRILAVAQYYHFAFLVVSLALLGFGASGSLLSIFPSWHEREVDPTSRKKIARILGISGLGFTASVGLSYGVINWLPFDSYSIAWDSKQVLYFGFYYLVLTIPFLFAGLGIGAVLSSSPGNSNQIYAINLLGSAVGILLALFIMQNAGVPGALLACAIVGLIAVIGPNWILKKVGRVLVWAIMFLGVVGLLLISVTNSRYLSPIAVTISPYKGLSYALRIPGAERLFGAWNAISRVDVVSGASTRVLPGMSYTFSGNPPAQIGLAIDADALQPITLVAPEAFSAADYLPESIAFHLHPNSKMLILDSGGGLGVLQALAGGANHVNAVVDNPLVLAAISKTASDKDVYSYPSVDTRIESSRIILGEDREQYELIFLPLSDPYRPVASGAYSLAENYILTVESFTDMLSHLTANGILIVTRWLQTPPSESVRLFATAIEALESSSIEKPENQIVAYRGIQTMTFLIKSSEWSEEELVQIREFLDERKFDIVWARNITPTELNRFNKLEQPFYYQQFGDLIAAQSRESYYSDYPFAIRPATDNSPFFFHFFKWEQTPEILAIIGRVWLPFGGSGYFVLLALLLLVILLSLLLIIFPLFVQHRQLVTKENGKGDGWKTGSRISPWLVFIYFGSIGVAFLFLEIPLIQKNILSMEHPTYAFTLVVFTLLTFSSIGSLSARRLWKARRWMLTLLFGLAILTPLWMNQIQDRTLEWSLVQRSLILGLSLAPMGILMGVPFPLGLTWLERAGSRMVPWAWAVNGCISVVAAVLAAILVLSTNFSVVLLLGALFYGVAALVLSTQT
jgi:hypothetical protein